MHIMVEDGITLLKMKNWIISYKKNFVVSIIGAIAGYCYWYFVGCASGSCAITSVWYRTAIYGAVMGWLVSDILFKPKVEKSKED